MVGLHAHAIFLGLVVSYTICNLSISFLAIYSLRSCFLINGFLIFLNVCSYQNHYKKIYALINIALTLKYIKYSCESILLIPASPLRICLHVYLRTPPRPLRDLLIFGEMLHLIRIGN